MNESVTITNLSEHASGDTSGLLVILSGPSGVGKDSVFDRMQALGRPYFFAITATTRARRPGEINGKDYMFLSPLEFDRMLNSGGFLEWAQVYGNRYGVPKTPIDNALKGGQTAIIKTDVQGASTIRKLISRAIFIFLAPSSMEELEKRLKRRMTDSQIDVSLRLKTARAEMGHQAMFDHIVINGDGELNHTVSEIEAIITLERERVQHTK